MSQRIFRVIVAFAVAGLIALVGAIIFFGYSSASGGPILAYDETDVSEMQYSSDIGSLIQYLNQIGFNLVAQTEIPESIVKSKVKNQRYQLSNSFERAIPFSRPISLRLYSDSKREGVLILFYARNPTWAVPFQKRALREFALIPLLTFWKHLTHKENA